MPASGSPSCTLHPALAGGLTRDLRTWPHHSITRHALDMALAKVNRGESDITASFGIYNGSLYWLNPDKFAHPRNPHIYAVADDLRALMQIHAVSDVEFVLNVDDYPKAVHKVAAAPGGAETLAMPLFSYTKRDPGDRGPSDRDVLVPSGAFRMSLFEQKLEGRSVRDWEQSYPWSNKASKAYFRGTPYCGMHHNFGRCSRYMLAHLARDHPAAPLDVGLVEYNEAHDTELARARSSGMRTGGPLAKAARKYDVEGQYRWLLHLDGHSFSNRLQALLLTNSLILKQQSPYVEYYYRALQAWQHYVPFYRHAADDILELLSNLTEHDDVARAIAARGQAFAHAHLNVDARQCYWRHLLYRWRRRLAFEPSLEARSHARRVRAKDYVCGECRRPRNPDLIGPWPPSHPCSKARLTMGARASVKGCRQAAATGGA